MTSSNLYSIPGIIETVQEFSPKTVLDVGAGSGKFGPLIREYVKSVEAIDAIEPTFLKESLHKPWYRKRWHQKVEDVDLRNEHYDLCLMISVLNKFPLEAGKAIISELQKHCTHFIITFEKTPQAHHTLWTPGDIEKSFGGLLVERALPDEWLLYV